MASTIPDHASEASFTLPGILADLPKACRQIYYVRIFRFRGRVSLSEFWLAQLGGAIVASLVSLASIAVLMAMGIDAAAALPWVLLPFPLWLAIGTLPAGTGRLRDAGFDPWLILLFFVPYFAGLLILIPMWIFKRKEDSASQVPQRNA